MSKNESPRGRYFKAEKCIKLFWKPQFSAKVAFSKVPAPNVFLSRESIKVEFFERTKACILKLKNA